MYGRWLPNMCTHISFKTHTRQQELLSTWLVPCQRLGVGFRIQVRVVGSGGERYSPVTKAVISPISRPLGGASKANLPSFRQNREYALEQPS